MTQPAHMLQHAGSGSIRQRPTLRREPHIHHVKVLCSLCAQVARAHIEGRSRLGARGEERRLQLLFSNCFSRTTFLDYYLLYYSINNTSSTVGHGPAAISLLEGSSEPAVNSVAPLSLTPGSRATSSGTPYGMSCAFEGGCCAQQPTDCTCLGGAHSHRRVMGGRMPV